MRRLGATPPRRATVSSSRMDVKCGGTSIIAGLVVYAPAWTDTTTTLPGVSLIVDQIDDGTGGGGLLTHPGMSGGMRG